MAAHFLIAELGSDGPSDRFDHANISRVSEFISEKAATNISAFRKAFLGAGTGAPVVASPAKGSPSATPPARGLPSATRPEEHGDRAKELKAALKSALRNHWNARLAETEKKDGGLTIDTAVNFSMSGIERAVKKAAAEGKRFNYLDAIPDLSSLNATRFGRERYEAISKELGSYGSFLRRPEIRGVINDLQALEPRPRLRGKPKRAVEHGDPSTEEIAVPVVPMTKPRSAEREAP